MKITVDLCWVNIVHRGGHVNCNLDADLISAPDLHVVWY